MEVVYLLVNPAARGLGRQHQHERILCALAERSSSVVQISPPSVAGVAPSVEAALGDGMTRLVIAGGDGLVHQGIQAVAGSEVVVGIVPVGSGNDFARALKIPSRLVSAVERALEPPTPIDLIQSGDRYAVSVVTGGFSGQVNAKANELPLPGSTCYTVATLAELGKLQPFELEMTIDGVIHNLKSTMFGVANTRYFGGGMDICPAAQPTDGMLDITVIGETSAFTLARMLPTVFFGRHLRHPAVTTYRAAEVTITTNPEQAVWADGERFVDGTLTAAAGALLVAGRVV